MKNKKSLTLLIFLLLFIGFIFVNESLSKYIGSVETSGNKEVALWKIKLNDETVSGSLTNTLDVTFEVEENPNVLSGKIAPNTRMYADFYIDPTDTEVAFEYEFELGEITIDKGTLPDGIVFEKVVLIENDTETEITKVDGVYNGTKLLPSTTTPFTIDDTVHIRIYIKWENDETYNEVDTLAGSSETKVTMPITVTIQQHI